MPDHFENAKDDILRRTAGNGGPSTVDLLNAMGALAKDVDEAIAASTKAAKERHDESTAAMKKHIQYADLRDKRIAALEAQSARWESECPQRLEGIICEAVKRADAQHRATHEEYVASMAVKRRSDDPEGADFREQREQRRQVWFMWMIGSKLGYIITGVSVGLAVWVIERLITGD